MENVYSINHYRGYVIKVYEQEADKEWIDWYSLTDEEQEEQDQEGNFPCNSFGEFGYQVCDILGKVLDSDFKAMGDDTCCLENAQGDIDCIIKESED